MNHPLHAQPSSKSKNRIFLTLLSATVILATALDARAGQHWTLQNREQTLRFALDLQNGNASYQVCALTNGIETVVVETSPLGLLRRDQNFTTNLTFVSASKVKKFDETYSMLIGKQSQLRNRGVEQAFTFQNERGTPIEIIVRAYADGVAFRYGFPGKSGEKITLTDEDTGFKIPMPGYAWMLPYDKIGTWAPAYEAEWQNKILVGKTSPLNCAGWCFPALFNIRDHWVLLTEADMNGTCYAAHLQPKADDGLYRIRLPEDAETYGVAPKEATAKLPWRSPWRVVIVGASPRVIMESSLVYHLNPPCALKDIFWIKPGRVAWSWWSDMGSPTDFKKSVVYVDLAAKMGWEYALVDSGWQDMRNDDIWKLNDYAKSKGIGLILWYNSGGAHSRVLDAGPRDCMDDPARRETEMARLEAAGIKGIKVDFMQSDKQYVIQLYLDIIRDAARHHLFVDFHGATIPRGWSRTYPNLLSMEAIRGAEQYWDVNFAANAHMFHTIYTFTRNVIGPMDYTPVIFGNSPERKPHQTTNPHELATAVAFESGLQHFADSATNYLATPDFVQDFLHTIPVAWDETRYLDGSPGELTVIARRKGNDWYLAALNGEATTKTIKVPLTFLGRGSYAGSLISDATDPRSFKHETLSVRKNDVLTVDLAGRGGFAARLIKQ